MTRHYPDLGGASDWLIICFILIKFVKHLLYVQQLLPCNFEICFKLDSNGEFLRVVLYISIHILTEKNKPTKETVNSRKRFLTRFLVKGLKPSEKRGSSVP